MKKNIIALIVVLIVVILITACTKDNAAEIVDTENAIPEETVSVEIPEPWMFNITYYHNRDKVELDLTTDIFGNQLNILTDKDSDICVGICSYPDKNFYLTETLFIVNEGDEIVEIDWDKEMGNLWWHMKGGQSAVVVINYGTEEYPKWVTFSIETYLR